MLGKYDGGMVGSDSGLLLGEVELGRVFYKPEYQTRDNRVCSSSDRRLSRVSRIFPTTL